MDHNLNHFWKSKFLTIKYFYKVFDDYPILKKYIPDNTKLERKLKCFCYTLIKSSIPDVYNSLRNDIEKNKKPKKNSRIEKAYIEVENEIFNEIEAIKVLEVNNNFNNFLEAENDNKSNFVRVSKKKAIHSELKFDP